MAILVDKKTRLIVQGLTGREGTFHAKASAAYGTQVVGGVTPGKGGTTHEGWPIFNTVQEAVDKKGENPPSARVSSLRQRLTIASRAEEPISRLGRRDRRDLALARQADIDLA